jgi:peptidoglycan/LPS O-acetylase OafA/YrhL
LAPAFLILLVVVLALTPALGDWWFQWKHLLPVLLYVGNWVIASPGHEGDLGAMNHTWSLAVEEQFYLVWPLLVGVLATRRRVVVAAIALSAASLVATWTAAGSGWERVAYGSDVALFGLCVGANIAVLRISSPKIGGSRLIPVACMCAIAAVTLTYGEVDTATALVILMPTVSLLAAAAVWASTGGVPVPRLEVAYLRWFGTRSYGIYLFQAPFLVAFRLHAGWPWPIMLVLLFTVPLLLAEASYRWVEMPMRRGSMTEVLHEADGRVGGR